MSDTKTIKQILEQSVGYSWTPISSFCPDRVAANRILRSLKTSTSYEVSDRNGEKYVRKTTVPIVVVEQLLSSIGLEQFAAGEVSVSSSDSLISLDVKGKDISLSITFTHSAAEQLSDLLAKQSIFNRGFTRASI